ncbi:hypothetical protein GQX74_009495 [Glossina fuscipes]|nr:hypothetical protein GQX74_009495 [Glossina fuscipes]
METNNSRFGFELLSIGGGYGALVEYVCVAGMIRLKNCKALNFKLMSDVVLTPFILSPILTLSKANHNPSSSLVLTSNPKYIVSGGANNRLKVYKSRKALIKVVNLDTNRRQ